MEDYCQSSAREDINILAEYVLKDEKGHKVEQGDIHREIQWHIDECKRQKKKNCGILAPWGHGKTEQVILRILDEVGKDLNIRTQLICNTDDNSTARVTSISKYIEDDEDYQKVYPSVRRSRNQSDSWGRHKIIIERDSKSKDGTLEAWGITTSGTGSRADLQIFDDPVDLRNAILNPAMRQQVKDSFRNVWQSRLTPDGFRIYIATVWHEDDLTHELMVNEEWNFLVMKISEDFERIECESCFKGNYDIPVWKIWNKEALITQRKDIGARAFDRGYRQDAINDEDRTFPSSDSIFDWNGNTNHIDNHWPRVTGMDPFGQAIVIFTLAINPHTHRKELVELRRGKWKSKEAILQLVDAWITNRSQIIVVENNAAQDAIIQWAKEIGRTSIPIVPFCTGKQKADPIYGLPSLEVEFANGSWNIPCGHIDPLDAEEPINVLKKELKGHPVASSWDCIMAMWFAKVGAEILINPLPQDDGEIIVQEEVGIEQVSIGDY